MSLSTFLNYRKALLSLFGDHEDASGTVKGYTDQLIRKHHTYNFPVGGKAVTPTANWPATRLTAQTGSVSATQPIAERVVYVADKQARVVEMMFTPAWSSTVSTSATTSWTLLVLKRGKGNGTISSTYSVTTFVGGLCSMSTGQPGFSNSFSQLAYNTAHRPNKLFIAASTTKPLLKRGDVLTAQVKKGNPGNASSNGAQFPPGVLRIVTEEE